jgi:hypothetical protein
MLTWTEVYGPSIVFFASSCIVYELAYGASKAARQFVDGELGPAILGVAMTMAALSYNANMVPRQAATLEDHAATTAHFESHKRTLDRFYWVGIVAKALGDVSFVVATAFWLRSADLSVRTRWLFLVALFGVRAHMASVNVAFALGIGSARWIELLALGALVAAWWLCAASLDYFDLFGPADPFTLWFAVPLACYTAASLHRLFLYDLPPSVVPAAAESKPKDAKSKKAD